VIDPSQDIGIVDVVAVTGDVTATNGNTERNYDIQAIGYGVSVGARGLGGTSGEDSTRGLSLDFIVEVPSGDRKLPPNELTGTFWMGQVEWAQPISPFLMNPFRYPYLGNKTALLKIGPGKGFGNDSNLVTPESRLSGNIFVGQSTPKNQPSNNTPSDS
jgi:hypothetical protein